jgi:hypothetical protein
LGLAAARRADLLRGGAAVGRFQRRDRTFGRRVEGRMKNMINLLPMAFRRQQIVRLRIIQWSAILCAVVVVGWTWTWIEERSAVALSQQLESLLREHAPSKTMLRQLVDMRQQLEKLKQEEAIAMELEYQRNALALLGVVSETAAATDGRLRVTKFELTGFQNVSSQAGREGQNGAPDGLLLRGVSLDNAAVVELLDGLQDSGVFSHVELLVSKEREGQGDQAALRDYEVRCQF